MPFTRSVTELDGARRIADDSENGFAALVSLKPCSGILQTLCESEREGRNATHTLITFSCDIRYFRTKPFLTSRRSILITFTKSYLCSETHVIQILCTVPPKRGFLRGEFLLV